MATRIVYSVKKPIVVNNYVVKTSDTLKLETSIKNYTGIPITIVDNKNHCFSIPPEDYGGHLLNNPYVEIIYGIGSRDGYVNVAIENTFKQYTDKEVSNGRALRFVIPLEELNSCSGSMFLEIPNIIVSILPKGLAPYYPYSYEGLKDLVCIEFKDAQLGTAIQYIGNDISPVLYTVHDDKVILLRAIEQCNVFKEFVIVQKNIGGENESIVIMIDDKDTLEKNNIYFSYDEAKKNSNAKQILELKKIKQEKKNNKYKNKNIKLDHKSKKKASKMSKKEYILNEFKNREDFNNYRYKQDLELEQIKMKHRYSQEEHKTKEFISSYKTALSIIGSIITLAILIKKTNK